MHIELDDLSRPAVHALLLEHLEDMHAWSPPGSMHVLDLAKLRAADISFWTVWDGPSLLGCGDPHSVFMSLSLGAVQA